MPTGERDPSVLGEQERKHAIVEVEVGAPLQFSEGPRLRARSVPPVSLVVINNK